MGGCVAAESATPPPPPPAGRVRGARGERGTPNPKSNPNPKSPRERARSNPKTIRAALEANRPAILAAVESTLPSGPHQRNRAVFELARALKGIAALHDADPRYLRSVAKAWHKRAYPFIGTKPFEETWTDFLRGWPRVRYPKGAGPMDAILERTETVDPPAVAERYEQPELRKLVSLCRELQRESGDGPFYLSCYTAAGLVGVHHTTAWRWLRTLLPADGVLLVAEPGKPGRRRATRYYYTGDEAPPVDDFVL